jgi:hypothetical protein
MRYQGVKPLRRQRGTPSDAELLQRSRRDPSAFSELYTRHVGDVHAWLSRRLAWAASDLTAETFARALLSIDRFRDDHNDAALPWLLGIARNVLADTVRRDQIETRARERGARSVPLLRSGIAADGAYLRVRYGSDGGGDGRLPTMRSQSPAGAVRAERADLGDGEASATVRMRRPGIAVLSATYDPGWTATVNGRRQPTRMVAPALVAVDVPTGTDQVVFRFHGYDDYPELLALSGLTLAMIALASMCLLRARRR